MATALDYSAGRPSGAAVKAAGHAGVIRYIGTPGNPKNMTPPEYADQVRQGVAVALVYEHLAGDSAGGFVAGQAAARVARADADAVGFPPDRPIYFAIDSDQVTDAQFGSAMAYLDGAVSVLGRTRVGVYGEFDVIERAVPNHAQFGWQTAAWSKGKRSAKAALYQRIGSTLVGGIGCDVNDILATDWGQHNAPEDDMQQSEFFTPWDGNIPSGTGGSMSVNQWMSGVLGRLDDLTKSTAALTAALAAATADPEITEAKIAAIFTDVVTKNIDITGTVHIGPAGAA